MKVLLGFVLLLVFGVVFVVHQSESHHDAHQKVEFRKEFGQPTNINDLTPLARKNRELAIWSQIKETVQRIMISEAVAKFALRGFDTNRDPKKLADATSAQEKAEKEKVVLARQLDLAWRFGQFEDETQNEWYRILERMVSETDPKWSGILKKIEELQPK